MPLFPFRFLTHVKQGRLTVIQILRDRLECVSKAKNIEFRKRLAGFYQRVGRGAESIAQWERIRQINPQDPDVLRLMQAQTVQRVVKLRRVQRLGTLLREVSPIERVRRIVTGRRCDGGEARRKVSRPGVRVDGSSVLQAKFAARCVGFPRRCDGFPPSRE